MKKSRYFLTLPVLALGLSLTAVNPATAMDKVTIAVPGVPPVFSTLFVFVAKEAGFYKKHGIDARIKPFNSGVAAAKAVATAKVDASLSPTAPVSKIVSNAGVKMVGLMGLEKPDWLIGLFVVTGELDRLFPYSEAERLANEASGLTKLLIVERGGHVANNRRYVYDAVTSDWMAEKLEARLDSN